MSSIEAPATPGAVSVPATRKDGLVGVWPAVGVVTAIPSLAGAAAPITEVTVGVNPTRVGSSKETVTFWDYGSSHARAQRLIILVGFILSPHPTFCFALLCPHHLKALTT